MVHLRPSAAVLAACLLGGCTTHLRTGLPVEGKITEGAVYNLPEVHYDVEVRRTLTECPLPPDEAHPVVVGQVAFAATATLSARSVAGEEVSIDYAALANFMKISDFSYERYPNGILKSVNASVDDRTADVAAEAFKAVASIGRMAIGLPAGGAVAEGAPAPTTAYLACSETAAQALASLPALRAAVKAAEAEVKKAAKARDDFATDHQEPQRAPDVATQAAALQRTLREKQEATAAATVAVAEAVAATTLVSRRVYQPGGILRSERDTLADATAEKTKPQDVVVLRSLESDGGAPRWLVHRLGKEMTLAKERSGDATWADPATPAEQARASAAAAGYWTEDAAAVREGLIRLTTGVARTTVSIVSGPLSRTTATPNIPAAPACGQDSEAPCGILYRTKGQGRVRVCAAAPSAGIPDDGTCIALSTSDERVLASDERAIPQLGRLASLGLKNKAFSNNVLAAEFAEDGSLTKFSYRKPRAEAVAIGQTINGGLDTATGLITYNRGAELRSLAAQKAENEARAGVVTSAIPLQQPSEQTKIENETKLIEARRKRVEEEILLRKKRQELEAIGGADDGMQ